MKQKHKTAHMKSAFIYAECSTAVRLKVGCLIVKDNRTISIGYNGTPSGWDNVCEEISFFTDGGKQLIQPLSKTKKEVLHAEANAITKLARSSESGDGSIAFITHAPCMDCAKLLYQSGVKEVYYSIAYRDFSGLEFLNKCNIKVEKMVEL
jgi:dCMP deaminase